jgi:hypothetical protein
MHKNFLSTYSLDVFVCPYETVCLWLNGFQLNLIFEICSGTFVANLILSHSSPDGNNLDSLSFCKVQAITNNTYPWHIDCSIHIMLQL